MNQRFAMPTLGLLLTIHAPLWAQGGHVRIRVTQPTGEALPRAVVSLLGSHDKPIASVETNNQGEVVWTRLPWHTTNFQVSCTGFRSARTTVNIIPYNYDEHLLEVTLPIPTEAYYPPLPIQPVKRHWWQILR